MKSHKFYFSRNSTRYGFQHRSQNDLRKSPARRHDARKLHHPGADHEGGPGKAADSLDGRDAAARNANAAVEKVLKTNKSETVDFMK